MNHKWKLLAIMASVFLIGFLLEETIDSSKLNDFQSLEETIEIISELFSVFVALSIFGITWYAYNKSRDNHSLFLGTTFLITGFLILFHLLSYPFMPDFINPNSSHKAAIFFLESRCNLAFLLLASVYIHKDSLPKLINKYVLVLFTIAILSVSLVSIFFHENSLFMAFDLNSYSTATILLLFVISIIIFPGGYLYTKRAKETGQNNLNYLAKGSIIVLFSNLVYFSYELSGHFLIITGFFYFYLAMYKSSIELPYEKLTIAEEKIRKGVENKYRTLFDNANDAIITTDLNYLVTSWNRSAVKLFGWEAHEVMGKELSSLIVPLNSHIQGKGIIHDTMDGKSAFGIETEKIRKDGSMIFVSLTTSQLLDSNHNLAGLSLIFRDITERKKAEYLLNRSKEFSETVINSMNDAISVIDVNNFKITDANSVFLKNCGMKKTEVIGKTCYEITHKRTQPCTPPDDICPLLDTLNTGKYSTVEHEHKTLTGEKRYVEVSTSPIIDENGKVVKVIHVSRDITERKQGENALHASEEKFRTIFEGAAIGMLLFELDSQSITVNPAFQRMFGCGPERVTFELIFELTHPEDREADLKLFNELNEGKREGYQIEKRYIRKDGILVLGLLTVSLVRGGDNKPRFIISMVEDITERKRLEETLRQSEEKYRRIVETCQEGIWMLDTSAKTSYINSRMAQIFGFTAKEILGRHVFDFMDADARIEAEKCLERLKQGIMETLDFRFSRKDGTDLWAIVSTNPIFDDKGQYVGALGMITDITERKLAEEKIKISLEEKEVLLREIHHRVKNNMQIVSSLLILQSENIEDKKYKDVFIESQNRILSMALIHEKLYQSRNLAQIDFKEYIDGIVSNIFESHGKNSNIRIENMVENIPIQIDYAIPCGLIINELVTNSLKYAFPERRQGKIQISVKSKDTNMIQISISDDGIGIPKDMDIRNTKSLGLHLVTALAEHQLNGEIILNRERGTEFQINFKGAK